MSAGIRFIRTPWQQVSDQSDRIAELVDAIPGWDGYEHAAETQDELRQAGSLMQQAAWLLDLAATREGQRDAAMGVQS